MPEWTIRIKAVIDDELTVEAETEEEALQNADSDWTFTEASQWESEVIEGPEGWDED